jgi:GDP-4-dehydro-6-deoxy-D-mannose reductase
MHILITGATGFAGGHLAAALGAQRDSELFGLSREGPPDQQSAPNALRLIACDLCDGPRIEALLRDVRPECIYHLAGYAQTGRSFSEPAAAWKGNLTATLTLYDAVARWGGKPRILYVGSGLIYGDSEGNDQSYDESCLLRPGSPYAASKAAADLASYQYTRSPGLDIVRARPFNHIGPRQSAQFAVANFARQIAAIEAGRQPPVLETGNLTPRRDLTDVRDVVRAYRLLMQKGKTGEAYNIGSGHAWSMREVLDGLLSRSEARIELRQKAELVRAAETAAIHADACKLRAETAWSPTYTLEQTLADTLAYWRATMSSGNGLAGSAAMK